MLGIVGDDGNDTVPDGEWDLLKEPLGVGTSSFGRVFPVLESSSLSGSVYSTFIAGCIDMREREEDVLLRRTVDEECPAKSSSESTAPGMTRVRGRATSMLPRLVSLFLAAILIVCDVSEESGGGKRISSRACACLRRVDTSSDRTSTSPRSTNMRFVPELRLRRMEDPSVSENILTVG